MPETSSKLLNLRIKQQTITRVNANKAIEKTSETLESDYIDTAEVEVLIKKLEKYQTELKQYSEEILLEIDDAEIDNALATVTNFDEKLFEAIEKLNIFVKSQKSDTGSQNAGRSEQHTTSSVRNQNAVKLPKLEIKKFAGDCLKWQEFWDSYESSIHSNFDLSAVDKFNYLKLYLTGDALDVVEGYRLTSANYDVVIEYLKERFGDPQVAIYSHIDAMLSLPISSQEIGQLQKTFDECERHIRSLVALGLPEDTFGQVFAPIVLSKLPIAVRMELHRKNGSQSWKLSKLRELLKEEIRARDMSHRSFNATTADSSESSGRKKEQFRSVQRSSTTSSATASSLVTTSAQKSRPCAFCEGPHYSDECAKYPDVASRRRQLKDKCLCCLRVGHVAKDCGDTQRACYHCKRSGHHRSLCFRKFAETPASAHQSTTLQLESEVQNQPEEQPTPTSVNLLSHGEKAILQTAVATVEGKHGKVSARLLFDTGCSRSFVCSRVCHSVGATLKGEEIISTAGFSDKKHKTATYKSFQFEIISRDGKKTTITANAIDSITCPIQKFPIDVVKHPFVTSIPLAEPLCQQTEMVPVDILIGGDYYYDFVGSEQIKCNDSLVFLASSFGYIAAGRLPSKDDSKASVLLLTRSDPIPDTNFNLEKFWKLEDVGVVEHEQSNDEVALKYFNETIRFKDDRYEVKWPWKTDCPRLSNNYELCKGQLRSLVNRIASKGDVLERYDATIQDQLTKGVIEEVPAVPDGDKIYHIPHHCVLTEQKTTTKLRVVYDASRKCRSSDQSLNEAIHRGPVLLADLCGLLIRFRTYSIALVSDIEKAFLQVGLQPPDRDVTRFLWLRDVKSGFYPDNVVEYRFCRVPFGVNASPFLLAGTVSHHLKKTDTPVAKKIDDDMYVDNVLSGVSTKEEAIDFYEEAKQLFRQASMNLREWFSNDPDVSSVFSESDRGKGSETKVMGVKWTLMEDMLSCSVGKFSPEDVQTKRQFIKAIASVFDPCGFFGPVVVTGKIVLQELWKTKQGWDDQLSSSLLQTIAPIIEQLQLIPKFQLPRRYGVIDLQSNSSLELHCFCDASSKAYAAVIYLRYRTESGFETSFVFSKCRVAPLKELTIPKLELMALVVGARLTDFVQKQIKLPISKKVVWSDSKCALHWVQGKEVVTTFVRNRVTEIKKHGIQDFKYVPTASNPADLPSRGITFETLSKSQLWWHGPNWLKLNSPEWPQNDVLPVSVVEGILPPISSVCLMTPLKKLTTPPPPKIFIDMTRFSSLFRLLMVMAWMLRFVNNCRHNMNNEKIIGPVSPVEKRKALVCLLKNIQHNEGIGKGTVDKKKTNLSLQLGFFVDKDGLVRCKGRYDNSSLNYDTKYPIFLPRDSHLTRLIVEDCHIRVGHDGIPHTLAKLRQKYWVTCGRSVIRRILRDCLLCRKLLGGHFRIPEQAPLPEFRSNISQPFSSVGIDYLGPLYVRDHNNEYSKVWICLFTCATIRAIHLELVEDMSAHQFLLCLRRFAAIYTIPKLIVCDNATQFHSSRRVLQKLWKIICNSDEVQSYSLKEEISWKFVVEMAPWMGGFYERMVGLTKVALKKALDRKHVSMMELQTIIIEISSLLNTRPLVYQSDEVGDSPLTPGHFLVRPRSSFPDATPVDTEYAEKKSLTDSLVLEWKRMQSLLNEFWQIWQKSYFVGLREYSKSAKQRNVSDIAPQQNTVVLIKDNYPRARWRIGIIKELIVSTDGEVRSAKVLTGNKMLNRPIKLLYPIESSLDNNIPCPENDLPKPSVSSRLPRKAALIARSKISQIARDDANVVEEE